MNARIGVAHECEPEDFDQGRAFDGDTWSGCIWEVDGTPEDEEPTVGDWLTSAKETHGIDVTKEFAEWEAEGRPSIRVDGRQVNSLLRRALLLGHDIYDSDTRSFIFARGDRITCAACPECSQRTAGDWLR